MKRCEFGHYYSDHLNSCPYCNDNSGQGVDHSTTAGFEEDGNTTSGFLDDETAIPTMPFEQQEQRTVQIGNQEFDKSPNIIIDNTNDIDKTIIISNDDNKEQDGEKINRPTRKLVGWLVSYTLDEMGLDYRLFEGKNVIGANVNCEVSVIQDKSVSSTHATILFRNNKFLLRDEFSTNGTFLNGEIVEDNTPQLKDGDIIKVGNTVFKFKVAIF